MKSLAVRLGICCLALSACTPQVASIGPISASPQLLDGKFVTSDGLSLPVRSWLPDKDPNGIILAVHGFNDYSKSFDAVPGSQGAGPALAAKGYAVIAYDQRGFGEAPNFGLWAGRDVLARDFSDFIRLLDQAYPNLPVYAVGVSMGAAVITVAMTESEALPADAIVLVAPAVWSRSTMPLLYRASLWLGAHLFPTARPSGRALGRQASDNIEMLRDAARDPLFIKNTRIDSIYGLTNLMDQAQQNIGDISVPTLYLYGANDHIVPKNATIRAGEKFLGNRNIRRLAFYEQGWHMMLRDLQAETVLADIAAYFENPTAPLPSGSDTDAWDRLKALE